MAFGGHEPFNCYIKYTNKATCFQVSSKLFKDVSVFYKKNSDVVSIISCLIRYIYQNASAAASYLSTDINAQYSLLTASRVV